MTPEELLERIKKAKRDGDTALDLLGEELTEIPPEIGQLTQLTSLDVSDNQLTSIPPEIGKLTRLTILRLNINPQLTSLPPEIGKLKHLKVLRLWDTGLLKLPPEIEHLKALQTLDLHVIRQGGLIKTLPPELGLLESLQTLTLTGLELTDPPPEIVEQGTEAILAYLRGKLEDERPLWESKLLVVGEGGVGKTQLLRALRGKKFQEGAESTTTWGIDIKKLELPHPDPGHEDVTMTLRCWDFGGQNIYHATHQFFLTARSMFLLAWNARLGWEQGKLHYWLDTIQALAPESPVLLVATHIDERDGGLPLDDLIKRYPQIVGEWSVSNARRDLNDNGIDRLRDVVAQTAASLPLMGQGWPVSYWRATEAIRELRAGPDKFIHASQLKDVMRDAKVAEESLPVLTEQLHQLGEIVYFRNDELISDTVFLDPSWVTKRISEVLVHDGIADGLGIFTRECMQQCWSDLDRPLQDDLLRLMEHFDLSYEIPDDPQDRSLVVERLALDPAPYENEWNTLRPESGFREIRMKFDPQSTRPAGIPGWFIARSHRFTTHTHWKYGALFQDDRREGRRRHLALLHSSSQFEHVELSVRGPNPQSFFSVLRDGLELTFKRFPGLKLKRSIPCPKPDRNDPESRCPHEFDLADLEDMMEAEPPMLMIQCPKCWTLVSLSELLFGLHWTTEGAVLNELNERSKRIEQSTEKTEQKTERILNELSDLRALTQRQFTFHFNKEQRLAESHCPRVFSLRPEKVKKWPRLKEKLFGVKWTLQLYCEEPGCWHPVADGGQYTIDEPSKWAKTLTPHVVRLVKVFKYAAPLVAPGLGYLAPGVSETISADVDLMTSLVDKLPDVEDESDLKDEYGLEPSEKHRAEGGASLRRLRNLLITLDPDQHKTPNLWGGLTKTVTPEGHWLWLCDDHRQPYVR